jgi:hypothetical protein
MPAINFLSALTLIFGVASAHAQSDPAVTGARPGHIPGVGTSLPLSDKASNIDANSVHAAVAPTLPTPSVGTDATARAYLLEARDDLAATGRTGQAQNALEMAESRQLNRVVPPSESIGQSQNQIVAQISAARAALGRGEIALTIRLIDETLQSMPAT